MSYKITSSWFHGKKAALLFLGILALALVSIIHSALPVSAANIENTHVPTSNIPETQWGKWGKGDLGMKFPTIKSPFLMGQKVIIPNQIAIQVDEIDRNWQPQSWQVSPRASAIQDAVGTNQEVIMVRFTVTNLSSTSLGYSNLYFSLIRSNKHEQRVGELNTLTSDQYGAFGDTNPWLNPGVTKHSMVPFIVNKGEQNLSFVYYVYNVEWIQNSGPQFIQPQGSTHSVPNQTPKFVDIARVSFTLSPSSSSTASPNSSGVKVFSPDATFTVQRTDIYSH